MILQAAIDDSGKSQGPVFVLAGFVLSACDWAAFADEWHAILVEPPKLDYFKMNEANLGLGEFSGISAPARHEKIQKFVSLIMRYKPLAIKEVMPRDLFERIFKGKIARGMDYPYFLCAHNLMVTMLKHQLEARWPMDDKVDFVFDEQGRESEPIRRAWSYSVSVLPPDLRPLVGGEPKHLDEKDFLPLQAADLFAWHVRRLYYEQSVGRNYNSPAWTSFSSLECVQDVKGWTESRLQRILEGLRSSDSVFEYDL